MMQNETLRERFDILSEVARLTEFNVGDADSVSTGVFRIPCPWCKVAQFHINGNTQMYYCFSCHRGGDVIRFVMEWCKCSFNTARMMLQAELEEREGKE